MQDRNVSPSPAAPATAFLRPPYPAGQTLSLDVPDAVMRSRTRFAMEINGRTSSTSPAAIASLACRRRHSSPRPGRTYGHPPHALPACLRAILENDTDGIVDGQQTHCNPACEQVICLSRVIGACVENLSSHVRHFPGDTSPFKEIIRPVHGDGTCFG